MKHEQNFKTLNKNLETNFRACVDTLSLVP